MSIIDSFNSISKKTPGFELITGKITRHLPKRTIVQLSDQNMLLPYVLKRFKHHILTLKHKKPLTSPSTYRSIGLI